MEPLLPGKNAQKTEGPDLRKPGAALRPEDQKTSHSVRETLQNLWRDLDLRPAAFASSFRGLVQPPGSKEEYEFLGQRIFRTMMRVLKRDWYFSPSRTC